MQSLKEEKDKKKAICRVCLNFDCEKLGRGLSLFEKINNVYVCEKIKYIANIGIKEDDNLPGRICSTCLRALVSACDFKHKCENSDSILHSLQHQELQVDEALKEQHIDIPIKEEEEDNNYEYDYIEENSPEIGTDTIQENEDPIEDKTNNHHFKSKALDLKLECHDCGGSFKSKCKLRVHWKTVHLPQQLMCPNCKKAHKTYKSFHNHMKRKSKACMTVSKIRVEGEGRSRMFYCKVCDKKSNRVNDMTLHLVTHTGERPYVCDICNKAFSQIGSLSGHKESVHKVNVKERTCHICGKNIKGRSNLYRHIKRHTDSQKTCNLCNKKFSTKETLRLHMKRHSGVKSYTCELCAKTFYTSNELRSHKVTVHLKSKNYECQQCDYKTQHCGLMYKHRKRHTGNNIACDHCGTFVTNEQQLILHKKRHFEKNFQCSMCSKKYYGKKHLMVHIRKVHNLYVSGLGRKDIKVEKLKGRGKSHI